MPVENHELTRAQVQKEDLGPILNVIAQDIYNEVGDSWHPPSNLSHDTHIDLAPLAGDLDYKTAMASSDYLQGGKYQSIDDLIETYRLNEGANFTLTWHSSSVNVLDEGLRTGIMMPLHVYCAMQSQKTYGYAFSDRIADDNLDIPHLVTTLRSSSFRKVVLALAKAPNGTYLGNSANPSSIVMNNPLRRIAVDSEFFLFDGEHVVLSPAVRHVLRAKYEGRNAHDFKTDHLNDIPQGNTSGCPVRFNSFKNIGQFAARFAEERGITQELMMSGTPSAIISGCEFVARCVEKVIASETGN